MRKSLFVLLLPGMAIAFGPADTVTCDETEWSPFVECVGQNIVQPGVICSAAYDGTGFKAKCVDRPTPASAVVCEDPPSHPVPFTFWECVLSHLENEDRVDVHRKYSGGLWKLLAHR